MERAGALALLALLAGPAGAAVPAPGQRIDAISVDVYDVFETDDPAEDRTLFTLANSVHIKTQERVVRRELLFAPGEGYDPALLAETERNLRRLPFVRRAEVEGVLTPEGKAVVMVRVYDAWTLEPVARLKRAGGINAVKAGLAERNLLGYGKTVSAVYEQNGRDAQKTVQWRDPQLLGRRLDSQLTAAEAPESRAYGLSLSKPFYASITRNALGFSGHYTESPSVPLDGGFLRPRGPKRRVYDAGFEYGHSFVATPRRSRRLRLGLLHFRSDKTPEEALKQLTFVQLGADLQEFQYIKERRLAKLSRDEDVNLGLELRPAVGFAPRLRSLGTTEEQFEPKLSVRKGWKGPAGLFLLRNDYRSLYVNGGNGARVVTVDAQFFRRLASWSTLAARAGYDHGWRLDPNAPLALGEDSGLRGYGAGQFLGTQRLLFNLEERLFLTEDLWKLIDLGAVLFFDSGYAWPAGQGLRPSDLRKSLGLGLRLGASRSSGNEPIRVDLAHALDDNGQRSPWSLSVLAGASF